MMDCWHTQLRLVSKYFPSERLRVRNASPYCNPKVETAFVYVTPAVEIREMRCPPHVVQRYREMGYTIIHVQEPRE